MLTQYRPGHDAAGASTAGGGAARELRALTLAVSHPILIADEPMEPADIVSLLLDGIRTKGSR